MKFYLISDNIDTLTGMRLAGIEGVCVHQKKHVLAALDEAMEREDVAVILMTEKLIDLVEDTVNLYKQTRKTPLISEIPDRHAESDVTASISRYVREAIGIEL
ncbi:MAG: V-type ATP synthase subunit F [Oscillospiraceae bacterium]|nr:V-type ATP synthase subunit F [Oscillospiraceae bacterium]MBQ8978855.1 V-type ATP synthase subunit F [Oscillospiraceae bacterium]